MNSRSKVPFFPFIALTLSFLFPVGVAHAEGYKDVFDTDGIRIDYAIDGVKLRPYDPEKDTDVPNWTGFKYNYKGIRQENDYRTYQQLVGTIYEGQTLYFDYTIESDHQDWVPSSEKSSEWLVRDSKWSSVAFRCGIRIHAELKYDASVTLNQRSYSNSGSFTVPENTANLWLELMIQGADYEAQGPGGYDFTPSFSHLVGVHIALKIKSLEDGKPLSETTTEASGFSGEDEGTNIPWIYIVGGSAAVLGLLGVVSRKKKGGKTKSKKAKKDRQQEEKKKADNRHSTFRMVLYKDFGNTLTLDDEPRKVGARIVETTPEGVQKDRADLTSHIQIDAEENCVARGAKMSGKYWMADIQALKGPGGVIPETAKLRIAFFGAHGTFVNHVVFKVEEAAEIVMDEAITFAACSGKTYDMEFGINHFDEEVTALSADAGSRAKGVFKIDVEQVKDVPGKFVVHVTECGNEKLASGDIDRYTCDISVKSRARSKPITGSFNIYRVGLGLRLDMRAIKAYLVEFDSTYDSERLATDPKVRKKFAESKITFKLITEDPETGEIQAVIPDSGPDFTYEDIRNESLLFRDKYGNDVPSPVGMMKPKFEFVGVDTDNTVIGVIHSTAGGLLPPNRGKAKVTLKVGWKGQTFEESITVPVISQPFVDIVDTREYNNWLNENQKKYEQMVDIRSKIAYDPRFAELLPFYYKVYALVEGYDPKFGIYEPDYQKIKRVFDKYCSGEIGHYFVNDAVWTPAWTEADENFNAFVATFGKMEKSIPVIGMRIALGFFTAGASELVLTPYSGMMKMRDYVNKGGDSAWEGFVVGSKDVLFWEGVFYVGGKAFEFAKQKGWTQTVKDKAKEGFSKLKENFKKLKEGSEKANGAKQATENLSKAKDFNTAGLGDKVKNAGDKVKHTKESAAAGANESIKRTRMKGDAVFSKNSLYAEECAKRARQDARKIVDEFEAVMNNPTATPEEMRRVTLMLQGNKNAQNLLRNHPSDMLRANFNAQMQEMYKKTDPVAIKKMAERLGVPESDIQVWNGATGNDARDLYLGRKIGADRDVTFQVRGKDGKWVDIKEEIMEECYAQAFDEVHFGFYSHDRQELLKTLKKFDQATVNGLEGAESYGQDLGRIIDKARQTEKLLDPQRVANTFKHKCKEFMGQGDSCRRQAESLYEAGLYDEAMRIQGYGEALVEEGIRQNVKQFKRILDPRIEALAAKGVGKDYSLLYEKVRILESLGNPPPKDALAITLEEARVVLKDQYGTTLEQVVEECANVIEEINPLLS